MNYDRGLFPNGQTAVRKAVPTEVFDTRIWESIKREVRNALLRANHPEYRTVGSNGSPGWMVAPMGNGSRARVVYWYPDNHPTPRPARRATIEAMLKRFDDTLYQAGFTVTMRESQTVETSTYSDMPLFLEVSLPRR